MASSNLGVKAGPVHFGNTVCFLQEVQLPVFRSDSVVARNILEVHKIVCIHNPTNQFKLQFETMVPWR